MKQRGERNTAERVFLCVISVINRVIPNDCQVAKEALYK